MAIVIPAILDAQLLQVQNHLRSVQDPATSVSSRPHVPYVAGNRVAELLRMLTGLIDSGTLTGVGVHTAADATNVITATSPATDQTEANALLNDIKTEYNLHRVMVGSNEHIGGDVTNIVTAANATDLATSVALANDIKAQFNAHLALNGATGHYGPELTNPVLVADATAVLAEVLALTNALSTNYTAHIANVDAGSLTSLIDNAAFTGVNSLVGTTFTFDAATTTAALQGVSVVVKSNGVNDIQFTEALPATVAVGDVGVLEFTAIDADLAQLDGGKPFGGSNPDVYGPGPSMVNAIIKLMELIGATVPTYLDYSSAEPFGLGSPHMGGHSQWGHGGADLLADALQQVRDGVEAYTAPA